MADIDQLDIRRIDGGLLLVFRELCRRGRTTAVAAHLGLSQSAVSHALGRLRDLFGDPLFLRKPHGLVPTQRALELAPRIEALIDLMGAAVRPEPGFEPALSSRWFHIAATEFAQESIGGPLVSRLRQASFGGGFMWQFLRGYLALDALRRGQLDLVLGRFETLPGGFVGEPLFEDRYCVVARRGHPAIEGCVSFDQWRTTGHVFVGSVSPGDNVIGPTIGEDAMPSPGDVRAVAIVPRWEMALAMVAASDTIATGSRRLAEHQAQRLGLQVLDPPDPAPPWTVSMVRREGADAGLDWFGEQVRTAAA
ncbi:MAG TPA: LysR family transcriptional regulator [Caulobacteraceae bacterium]|jgi:DNA-binding transcriptional LysR family regulator|nr:LysR family transcriptional regulator [Caulobacteraceae bacterium]